VKKRPETGGGGGGGGGRLRSGELVCRWPLDSFIFRGPTASEPWHSPSWTGLKLSDVQSTEKAVEVE
jgi:hypothetical protein